MKIRLCIVVLLLPVLMQLFTTPRVIACGPDFGEEQRETDLYQWETIAFMNNLLHFIPDREQADKILYNAINNKSLSGLMTGCTILLKDLPPSDLIQTQDVSACIDATRNVPINDPGFAIKVFGCRGLIAGSITNCVDLYPQGKEWEDLREYQAIRNKGASANAPDWDAYIQKFPNGRRVIEASYALLWNNMSTQISDGYTTSDVYKNTNPQVFNNLLSETNALLIKAKDHPLYPWIESLKARILYFQGNDEEALKIYRKNGDFDSWLRVAVDLCRRTRDPEKLFDIFTPAELAAVWNNVSSTGGASRIEAVLEKLGYSVRQITNEEAKELFLAKILNYVPRRYASDLLNKLHPSAVWQTAVLPWTYAELKKADKNNGFPLEWFNKAIHAKNGFDAIRADSAEEISAYYLKNKNWFESVKYLKKAIELDPEYTEDSLALFKMYDFEVPLNSLIEMSKSFPDTKPVLAFRFARVQDWSKAIELGKRYNLPWKVWKTISDLSDKLKTSLSKRQQAEIYLELAKTYWQGENNILWAAKIAPDGYSAFPPPLYEKENETGIEVALKKVQKKPKPNQPSVYTSNRVSAEERLWSLRYAVKAMELSTPGSLTWKDARKLADLSYNKLTNSDYGTFWKQWLENTGLPQKLRLLGRQKS